MTKINTLIILGFVVAIVGTGISTMFLPCDWVFVVDSIGYTDCISYRE